jgi:hypothetical protein
MKNKIWNKTVIVTDEQEVEIYPNFVSPFINNQLNKDIIQCQLKHKCFLLKSI